MLSKWLLQFLAFGGLSGLQTKGHQLPSTPALSLFWSLQVSSYVTPSFCHLCGGGVHGKHMLCHGAAPQPMCVLSTALRSSPHLLPLVNKHWEKAGQALATMCLPPPPKKTTGQWGKEKQGSCVSQH